MQTAHATATLAKRHGLDHTALHERLSPQEYRQALQDELYTLQPRLHVRGQHRGPRSATDTGARAAVTDFDFYLDCSAKAQIQAVQLRHAATADWLTYRDSEEALDSLFDKLSTTHSSSIIICKECNAPTHPEQTETIWRLSRSVKYGGNIAVSATLGDDRVQPLAAHKSVVSTSPDSEHEAPEIRVSWAVDWPFDEDQETVEPPASERQGLVVDRLAGWDTTVQDAIVSQKRGVARREDVRKDGRSPMRRARAEKHLVDQVIQGDDMQGVQSQWTHARARGIDED